MRRGFGESCNRKCRGRISAQPRVAPGPVIWRLSHQASLPANTHQDGCLSGPLRSPIPGTVSAVGQGRCSVDGAEACWVSKAGLGWSGGRLWDGGAMAWPRVWTVAAGVAPALRSRPRGQSNLGHRRPSWDFQSGGKSCQDEGPSGFSSTGGEASCGRALPVGPGSGGAAQTPQSSMVSAEMPAPACSLGR